MEMHKYYVLYSCVYAVHCLSMTYNNLRHFKRHALVHDLNPGMDLLNPGVDKGDEGVHQS